MTVRSLIVVTAMYMLITSIASAKIWRVDNNPGNPGADFTSLQNAHNGASDSDTLYVSGSPNSYGNLTLTKKLHIFGPGYFLGENEDTQAYTATAKSGEIYFNAGSEGSVIMGMDILNIVHMNTNNITLKRNSIILSSSNNYSIITGDNLSNIVILQNYIYNTHDGSYGFYDPGFHWRGSIGIGQSNYNITISNNFIAVGGPDANSRSVYSLTTSTNLILSHNVLLGNLTISNASIQNNIMRSGSFSGSSNNVQYNIANGAQFGSENGNQSSVDMTTVFVGVGSSDGQWQIITGGPADGTGLDGVVIGMFGGVAPYVLSGIPPIPAIYFFSGSDIVNQGLPIRVKIKSHN